MSIRALRTFVSIHQHGSFRAAADAEGLTPSAVSHQIKALEYALDVQLFDRSVKVPRLTARGVALVGRAQSILREYDRLAMDLAEHDDMAGELRIGAVPTTLTALVPKALAAMRQAHPALTVRLVPGLTNQLLVQLDRGLIAAAVISRPQVLPPNHVFREITSEPLMLLSSDKETETNARKLLQSRPFIRFTREAVVGSAIESWLQDAQITVSEAMELEGLDAIKSMVANGLGVSIVPLSQVDETRGLPLRWIALGKDGPVRTIGVIHRISADSPQMLDALVKALGNAAKSRRK